jgi:hypothetical protein
MTKASIVFIDLRVSNYSSLISSLPTGCEMAIAANDAILLAGWSVAATDGFITDLLS